MIRRLALSLLALAVLAVPAQAAARPERAPMQLIDLSQLSLMERLALNPAERSTFLTSLTPQEAEELSHNWRAWARPKQLAPQSFVNGEKRTWLVLAGRGFGKTRMGAEYLHDAVTSGRVKTGRVAIVGATAADVRDVMIDGESGILKTARPNNPVRYRAGLRRLEWDNGAFAILYSAEEPDRLRGPQHELAWADELAAWRYAETWDQLQFGLRLGNPQSIITTTPRPTPIIKELAKDPTTVMTVGTTYENRSNLAPAFFAQIIKKYEGTRLGRQELTAEILDDHPGALWKQGMLDALRVDSAPVLRRIVVSVDPSVAEDGGGDECGIVVSGVGPCRCRARTVSDPTEDHGFVMEDLSGAMGPLDWAKAAVNGYRDHHADRVIAEVNNGGALVEVNLRVVDAAVSYKSVHASRGKRSRAEPIAALYEQGKVHHVGNLAKLESEMTTWDASTSMPSPNRMDALVWGLTELMVDGEEPAAYGDMPIHLGRRRA